MKNILVILIAGLLLMGGSVFADDVFIDSDGNVETGVSASGNLEVEGGSGEHGIAGYTSGTGAAGVYGKNTTSGNYGILGYDSYGVFGFGSTGYAGFFWGNAYVTGDLTVAGAFIANETDPQVGSLLNGNWCASNGSQIDCDQGTPVINEADPLFSASPASGITSGLITDWNTAFGWGDHGAAGYDTTNDGWTGTGDVYTLSGNVGIGTDAPSQKLTVAGTIESTSGGVKFPDGTVQTTAAAPSWHQKLPAAERFVLVLDDEAVLDKETGLIWEKTPYSLNASFVQSMNYCTNVNVGGRKGWHLPTIEQLASLVDPTQTNPSLPSGHPFTGVFSVGYWSATTNAQILLDSWYVDFGSGDVTMDDRRNNHSTWCVRGGQSHNAIGLVYN